MAFSLISHAGSATGVTSGIDTTGANLIIINDSFFGGSSTPTDSKGNIWTGLTGQGVGGRAVRLYYCYNPTVGSGHTFTSTAAFSSIQVQAWSGSAASPFDQENGGVGVLQPGSITPTEDNELLVVGLSHSDGTVTQSINGGFTIPPGNDIANSGNDGGAMAYLVQTSAAAANPAWSPGTNARTVIASFKAGAGGGGGTVKPWFLHASQIAIGGPG